MKFTKLLIKRVFIFVVGFFILSSCSIINPSTVSINNTVNANSISSVIGNTSNTNSINSVTENTTNTSVNSTSLENNIVETAAKSIYFAVKQLTKTQYNLPGKMTVKEGEKSYQVTIEWAGEPAERFTFERFENYVYATVNLPEENEEPITGKITATAKYESATATREFPVILMPTEKIDSKEKTIAEVKNVAVGQYVTITGVVVDARNNKGYYIVDETGAIYVYDSNRTSGVGTTIAWETKVKLTAMRGESNGDHNKSSVQLVYNEVATITAMGKEDMPLTGAQDLTITQFKAWKGDGSEDYSGGFYKVRGYLAKYSHTSKDGKTYTIYEVVDDAGKYIQFYAVDSTVFATELADYFAEGKTSTETSTSGETTKTTAQFDVYLAVYDRQVSKKKWRVAPLAFVQVD